MLRRSRTCVRSSRTHRPTCGALGLLCLATAACAPRPVEPGRSVAVTRLDRDDVFVLSGELQARRSLELSPPDADGELRLRWLAEDGAEVRAGQALIVFDDARLAGTLEDKRLRLRQAEIDLEGRLRSDRAELEARLAALERAEIEARKTALAASVPAALQARRDWQEKQNSHARAETERAKARLELEAARATATAEQQRLHLARAKAQRDLEQAQRRRRSFEVHAPRDGIFIVRDHYRRDEGRKLQAGDVVFPGLPVASLPDLTEMEVLARLAAVDQGRVRAGQPARVVLDSFPEHAYPGRVRGVGELAEPGSGFRVEVALEATDAARMRPGMSARVEVLRGRLAGALWVPRAALDLQGPQPSARRVSGARVELRLGACLPDACVVEAGLREGERVALP